MFSQCIKHSNSISTLRSWGAILTLTLATFIVVTTEMLPVGLLTPIANQFSISIGLSALPYSWYQGILWCLPILDRY